MELIILIFARRIFNIKNKNKSELKTHIFHLKVNLCISKFDKKKRYFLREKSKKLDKLL